MAEKSRLEPNTPEFQRLLNRDFPGHTEPGEPYDPNSIAMRSRIPRYCNGKLITETETTKEYEARLRKSRETPLP